MCVNALRYMPVIVLCLKFCNGIDEVCDRRPLGTKTDPLPPDNSFLIDIEELRENKYIPKQTYTVHLRSRDPKNTFIAFTITLGEDQVENKLNPRKPILLKPGRLELISGTDTAKYHKYCNNTIIESDITAKNSVKVIWTAPDKDNKCVTIFAVVAIKPDVWYNFDGPLSKRVCEDRRKAYDMLPMENDNCQVCVDARYQLTFEGLWSYNTHPTMFPNTTKPAQFSDVVGASHSNDFTLYKYNKEASNGLKMLAEQGNTTELEGEIQKKLDKSVRTILKATGPAQTNMKTVTNFRVTRIHHLVSLATALIPSPDWFLGVANFELCSVTSNEWADNAIYNLYPLDAGTDKGATFDAANEEMLPPQPISSSDIINTLPKEQVKPFARLHFKLIRTYNTSECVTQEPVTVSPSDSDEETGTEGNDNRESQEPEPPVFQTTTSEAPVSVDPSSNPGCPMTPWEDWMECEGPCVDGKVSGMKIRLRYHMVDDVVVGKYGANVNDDLKVPKYCEESEKTFDTEPCEEDC